MTHDDDDDDDDGDDDDDDDDDDDPLRCREGSWSDEEYMLPCF